MNRGVERGVRMMRVNNKGGRIGIYVEQIIEYVLRIV